MSGKLLFGAGGGIGAGLAVVMMTSLAAGASTCTTRGGSGGSGYYYSGQYSADFPTYSYDGVEGSVSVDGLTIPNGAYNAAHNIQYIAQATIATDCQLSGYPCWMQNGYGIGNVGGTIATYQQAYFEMNSWYQYDAIFWPDTTFGLAQDDHYTNYWNGQTQSGGGYGSCEGKGGLGEFDTYVDTHNGQGPRLMWYGWLDGWFCTQLFAQSEVWVDTGMTCPAIPEWEYFGTSGHGGVTSYDQLKASYAGQNTGWFAWNYNVVPTASNGPNNPYSRSYISSNSAFDTWGS
jgi:hypothetical protein